MAQNPDQHRLSEEEHQAIFERDIKPDLFAGAKPSSQPVAVIFGGQPGAGKSAAVDEAMNELGPRGGAVQIIGDDLRGYSLSEQGLRDFKRAFLRELKHVSVIYPQARVSDGKAGLILYPSPTHVALKSTPIQPSLGF